MSDNYKDYDLKNWMREELESTSEQMEENVIVPEEKKDSIFITIVKKIYEIIYEIINYSIIAWLISYVLIWLYETLFEPVQPLAYFIGWFLTFCILQFKTLPFAFRKLKNLN